MDINTGIPWSSQQIMQKMQKIHIRLEELRLRLNAAVEPHTNTEILHLSIELQPLYKALIMYNLDEFIALNLETALWNDCFRTALTRYNRTDTSLFNFMIHSGVGFYLGLIQDIAFISDISCITNTPSSTKLYCTSSTKNNDNFIKPSRNNIYYIIQSCLLHVGDLLRFRGSNYPEAMKMYDKSAAVWPSNGHPYHQMGLTHLQLLIVSTATVDNQVLMDGLLSCFYYFARSLSVSNRYLLAYQSIESIVKSKIEPLTELAKPQEMLRQFMLSIHNNLKSDSLSQIMYPVVAKQQVHVSTLVKMIVVALWNNWENQFSPTSLEIIACIFNSLLGSALATLGDPEKLAYSVPTLKLLVEWMNWCQDNPTMEALYSQLNTSALVHILNQLRTNTQFSIKDPDTWVLKAILPEEKKLIGFLPLDYSVCFNAGSSEGSGVHPTTNNSSNANALLGATPVGHHHSDNKEVILSVNLRIHRIVSVAMKMAANNNCFMLDGNEFVEKTNSSTVPTPVQSSSGNVSPRIISPTSNINLDVLEQTARNYHADLSPLTYAASYVTAGSGMDSLTTAQDGFSSIWTQDTENTESNWN